MTLKEAAFKVLSGGGVIAAVIVLLTYFTNLDDPPSAQIPDDVETGFRPHVVFIFADDYGYNDIEYHGKSEGSVIRTPNLDRLAAEGVKLDNYYVQPICTPSRSQLLSGRYQIHTGLQHGALFEMQRNSLPADEVTLPELMKRRGYSTHMVGKWHLGFYQDACMPTKRGFDSFFGFLNGEEDHYHHDVTVGFYGEVVHGKDLYEDATPAVGYRGQYSTHMYTEKAIDIINSHDGEEPLFLYIAYQAPHSPVQVPPEYEVPYSNISDPTRRTYAGMVGCMDEAVARVTEALGKAGLYNDTIIVFSSDNGGATSDGANNWPLRGNKSTLWEGGIRGVGFVHSPLLPESTRGTINRELIHVSDWLPTIVAGMAGGSVNGTKPLDGYNMWETIRHNAPSPRHELLHNLDPLSIAPMTSLETMPVKDLFWTRELSRTVLTLPSYDRFNVSMQAALRVGDWKIQTGLGESGCWVPPPESSFSMRCPVPDPQKRIWLFNITADPLEQNDLSEARPEIVEQLLYRLDEYYQDLVPVRYPLPDVEANPALRNGVWGPWV